MTSIAQIDPSQARTFLNALGDDLRWRLIRADGPENRWTERSDDPGQPPDRLPLDRMDTSHSWHIRPMPDAGRYRLTLLDDATDATIQQLIANGLPPTAIVETSPGRLQVWHRWPWAFPRDKAHRLVRHLQQIYHTDPGANAPGHPGRLPGSRNWKPERNGCPVRLVSTGRALSDDQARAWLARFPVPPEDTAVKPRPATPTSTSVYANANDPRYLVLLSRFDPATVWQQAFGKSGDESRADLAVAVRAVSLQWPDDHIIPMILAQMDAVRRKKHAPVAKYAARTIVKARQMLGIPAPWVWHGGQFDPQKQFPWIESTRRGA